MRQDRRQNIEKDIEGKVIFIGGHKSPEYGKKIFHASHIEPGQNRAVYGCKDNTNTKIAETGAQKVSNRPDKEHFSEE